MMKIYHHIEQTIGGLFTFPHTVDEIQVGAVGTSWCQTSMCLYVRFKNNSIFVAHMLANTDRSEEVPKASVSNSKAAGENLENFVVNPDEGGEYVDDLETNSDESEAGFSAFEKIWNSGPKKGKRLKEIVTSQLENELGSHMGDEVVEAFVVSQSIEEPEANARWMKEAVEEFFSPTPINVHEAHGFAAGPNFETLLFDDVNGDHPTTYGWQSARPMLTEKQLRDHEYGAWKFLNLKGNKWELGIDQGYGAVQEEYDASQEDDMSQE